MSETRPAHTCKVAVDRAATYARRVELHLAEGNAEAAHEMVDEAFASEEDCDPNPLNWTVQQLGLPMRTCNALDFECDPEDPRSSVLYVRQLVEMSRDDLLSIGNFGCRCVDEVERALDCEGLKLTEPVEV